MLTGMRVVQKLVELDLHSNLLTGTLPTQWGASGNWGNLTTLAFYDNSLSGTIPEFWGGAGSFLDLEQMCAARASAAFASTDLCTR